MKRVRTLLARSIVLALLLLPPVLLLVAHGRLSLAVGVPVLRIQRAKRSNQCAGPVRPSEVSH